MGYIYLASPYSHENPEVVEGRYRDVLRITSELMNKHRLHIFSPIINCHELAKVHTLPGDFAFWKEYNQAILEFADELYVLKLLGWEQSKGIKGEMLYVFDTLGYSKIHLVDPDSLEITILDYADFKEQFPD
jgi:hypothetical protein